MLSTSFLYMRKMFEILREWCSLASFEIVHKNCYAENDVDME
jgi:hypothetical protein